MRQARSLLLENLIKSVQMEAVFSGLLFSFSSFSFLSLWWETSGISISPILKKEWLNGVVVMIENITGIFLDSLEAEPCC